MVGRNPDDLYPELGAPQGEAAARGARAVSVADPSNPGRMAVADLDLTVRAGEIVCLYGLMGAGRTELLETLAGRLPAQTGTVHVDGVDVTTAPIGERIARGLALVPEDRQRDGLVQTMSVGDNLSLASIRSFLRGPFVAAGAEDDAVRRTIADVTVKASGPGAAIGSLSGGNQQKVVIGKVLLTGPRVLLLDEPTRGIDVGAKADIFTLMADAGPGRARGAVRDLRARRGAARRRPRARPAPRPGRARARPPHHHEGGPHGGVGRRDGPGRPRTRLAPPAPTRALSRGGADMSAAARRRARPRPRPAWVLRAGDVLLELRAFIALAIIIVIFAALSDTYLTGSNVITMTRHVAINALLALGMLLVILTGGIDLSVGSIVGLSGIVAGVLLQGWEIPSLRRHPLPAGVGGHPRLPRGRDRGRHPQRVTRHTVQGRTVHRHPRHALRRARHRPADLQRCDVPAAAAARPSSATPASAGSGPAGCSASRSRSGSWSSFAVVIWVLIRKMPFGRWLYAAGGNQRAAQLSGVPVRRVTMRVYMISGLCAAMVGLIIASELTSAAPQTGETFELNAIAAVVIGGASLAGGRGTVRGALVGAFVIGFLSDGLVMVGVSTFWQIVIKGAVIVLAVMLDQGQQRLKRSQAAAAAAADVRHEGPTSTPPRTPAPAAA